MQKGQILPTEKQQRAAFLEGIAESFQCNPKLKVEKTDFCRREWDVLKSSASFSF